MLEAAVTNDGATRSIGMYVKINCAKPGNPGAPMIGVKEFLDANGEGLLGATPSVGGPKARQERLQLFCDIADADRLARSMRAGFERLQKFLADARATGLGDEDDGGQSREEIGLMSIRLADLLTETCPDRPRGRCRDMSRATGMTSSRRLDRDLDARSMVLRRETEETVMNKFYLEMPLEDLCTKVLFELEVASEGLLSPDIAGSAHDRAIMARWAARVSGEGGLRSGVSKTIAPILALLENQLDEETTGYRNVFEGHPDTEDGPVGTIVRMRIVTDRGERICTWHDRLRRLRHMLQVAESRLGAERAVNRRMAL